MNLFMTKLIGWLLIFFGMFLMAIVAFVPALEDTIIAWFIAIPGFISMLAGYIVFLIFWKCPYCGKHLPWQMGLDFCPYCGGTLGE